MLELFREVAHELAGDALGVGLFALDVRDDLLLDFADDDVRVKSYSTSFTSPASTSGPSCPRRASLVARKSA